MIIVTMHLSASDSTFSKMTMCLSRSPPVCNISRLGSPISLPLHLHRHSPCTNRTMIHSSMTTRRMSCPRCILLVMAISMASKVPPTSIQHTHTALAPSMASNTTAIFTMPPMVINSMMKMTTTSGQSQLLHRRRRAKLLTRKYASITYLQPRADWNDKLGRTSHDMCRKRPTRPAGSCLFDIHFERS